MFRYSVSRAAVVLLLAVGLVAANATTSAAASRPMSVGIFEDRAIFESDAGAWFDRIASVDAEFVRVTVRWGEVAPRDRSILRDPTDPGDPGYDWTRIDTAVRAAQDRRLTVLIAFLTAPAWAEGANRPQSTRPGTWRPDAAELGRFAVAIARRYSGRYSDPVRPGAFLPRVRHWQAWNEPNLPEFLEPQWRGRGRSVEPVSPVIYRQMLRAVYSGVKSVAQDNVVVSAGTGPYGDPPGVRRMSPVRFLRELLCISESGRRTTGCSEPALFDVLDHHPYATSSPTTSARLRENVAMPDLHKLVKVLRAAERTGTAAPRGRKRLWATEFSWDSRGPDPDGVPTRRHADWLQEGLYVLWSQGVELAMWYLARDQEPTPTFDQTYQSGLWFRNGRPKLAARAFAFPFVTLPRRSTTRLWGIAPRGGSVTIEHLAANTWRPVKRVAAGPSGVFETSLPHQVRGRLRARQGNDTSLDRTVRTPR